LFAKEKINRIEIDLTGSCNAKCPLCARNYKHFETKYNERHLNEITAQFDEFINLTHVHLVGTVSEPTLYKHFHDLCHYLVKRKIHIEVCTNGDTHNPEWWATLGEILTERDSVYFSVCGSTQELHETYRVNCSLENLLNNARAFRKANKYGVDYIQHIEFGYNREDINSPRMKEIMAEFSHVNMTLTYFTRDKSIYKNQFNIDKLLISNEYLEKYNIIVDYTKKKWENRAEKSCEIDCRSVYERSLHIDQFGKVFPCYIWLEESRIKDWNGNHKEILDFKYECCQYCEKNAKKMLSMWGCELT
jgi:MoaA/NifB/PqqE/SkfB family radical SAM enzyme